MAGNQDWLPRSRAEMLVMCREWIGVMTTETRTAWGVPQDQFLELGTLFGAAQELLRKAESSDRTPVITEQCREAFDALAGKMRFFKKHYFLVPPLEEADLVRLGLKIPDPHPTPVPRPKNQVEADLVFPGIHLVELQKIRPVSGTAPDSRSDYGVRVYYGLSDAPSEAWRFRVTEAPKTGRDLPYSIFTRRKKERFDFDGESGSTVYFCLRYENSKGGKEGEGPFGPMLSAVIP